MTLAIYYLITLFVALLCWPYTYGAKVWWRIPWVLVGLAIMAFPVFLPLNHAFYYGLLGNFTVFLWSADTYMGKEDRRASVLIGGIVLVLLPASWRWPVESWLGVCLVPTLGHIIVSGGAWGLLKGLGVIKG